MSSASLHADIRKACRSRLTTMAAFPFPAAQQAFEGFSFVPTTGTPFIEDRLVGQGDTPRSNSAIEHNLSYIVTLKYPSDEGTVDIEGMAGALLDRFKVGTVLTSGSSSATCMKAERRGAIVTEPEWLILTVQVTLVAFTLD